MFRHYKALKVLVTSRELAQCLCLCVCVQPGQAADVFSSMSGDFMKPVIDMVDELLDAGVNVTVYNGQLDLIVDTMGNNSNNPIYFWSASVNISPQSGT